MKKPDEINLLLDAVYKKTFSKDMRDDGTGEQIRRLLMDAHRFTLDTPMSSFLADLSFQSWNKCGQRWDKQTNRPEELASHKLEAIEHLRQSARLPHKVTWFEFDAAAYHDRFDVLTGREVVDGRATRLGMLVYETDELTYQCIPCMGDERGAVILFFSYLWTAGNNALPPALENLYTKFYNTLPMTTINYPSNHTRLVRTFPHIDPRKHYKDFEYALFEFCGELRLFWTLLASVNDVPVHSDYVSSGHRSFFARGSIRKFLDYKILRLNVPHNANIVKTARNIIAKIRRRAHNVRGHWRKDHWHPGNKIWIREHQRGDATLGVVRHDYVVTHKGIDNDQRS
jgi:hypothetical protein